MPSATVITRASALAFLACLAGPAAYAQADAAPPSANAAAAWRATSRLGYAPTPASAQAADATPRAWALQQIDAAYAASRRPPAIPAELAGINAPLGDIARGFYAEREARKTRREANKPGAVMQNANAGPEKFSREMAQDAAAWRLMSCSDPALENPLLARMTEFWFNHLNVFVGKGPVRPFVGHYVVNVIRPNALGRFEDLLLASARHPAMLLYLDQAQSNNRGINENYARELMELHTLGVNSGYTQKDVRELARILTGWTVNLRDGEGFRFAERLHDKDGKVLLGRTFGSEGVAEGEEAIRYLARRPETARRISTRLASFFVADKPSPALVDRLAATFTATQGDIRAVMRTLVESPEFWAKDNTLFKTPLDFACSALTAAGGVKERRDIVQTLGFLAQAGQPMHGWQTPDGYKTDAGTWLAPEALTRRADYALALAQRTPEPSYLNAFFSTATRERIAREPAQLRAGLMLASPDFMRK
ncbi:MULTISPECIES: DUF1800 domain-containing protein [unclassified Polaromonas]|uniref:DUF1800 domain-containing protein n=1 Tax=unclassified Polaromonas TaxID=2638319 RepID=UPI000F09A2F1|nr:MULTISPECIES: DUF1800 domain-containing protein [unclassified Polaromonas]AYQ28576.1 DUF1800 domain-containing protein [Polaromonas sp. SP1]QGJ20307.1 DUF1800 family protein [Polaromonas sp. Pch-P]